MEVIAPPNAVIASRATAVCCEAGESRRPFGVPEPLGAAAYGAGRRRSRGALLGGMSMDVKKGFREVEEKSHELGREVDGHDIGDDIGNAGDEIRKDLGNTGDDIRRGLDDAKRNAERRGDMTDDDPFTKEPYNEPYKDQPR
jgi:hypothetical protein